MALDHEVAHLIQIQPQVQPEQTEDQLPLFADSSEPATAPTEVAQGPQPGDHEKLTYTQAAIDAAISEGAFKEAGRANTGTTAITTTGVAAPDSAPAKAPSGKTSRRSFLIAAGATLLTSAAGVTAYKILGSASASEATPTQNSTPESTAEVSKQVVDHAEYHGIRFAAEVMTGKDPHKGLPDTTTLSKELAWNISGVFSNTESVDINACIKAITKLDPLENPDDQNVALLLRWAANMAQKRNEPLDPTAAITTNNAFAGVVATITPLSESSLLNGQQYFPAKASYVDNTGKPIVGQYPEAFTLYIDKDPMSGVCSITAGMPLFAQAQ